MHKKFQLEDHFRKKTHEQNLSNCKSWKVSALDQNFCGLIRDSRSQNLLLGRECELYFIFCFLDNHRRRQRVSKNKQSFYEDNYLQRWWHCSWYSSHAQRQMLVPTTISWCSSSYMDLLSASCYCSHLNWALRMAVLWYDAVKNSNSFYACDKRLRLRWECSSHSNLCEAIGQSDHREDGGRKLQNIRGSSSLFCIENWKAPKMGRKGKRTSHLNQLMPREGHSLHGEAALARVEAKGLYSAGCQSWCASEAGNVLRGLESIRH